MFNKNKTFSLGLKSTEIRNRIFGEKKNSLGLKSTEIRNRISGANSNKRTHLETRLIFKRWKKEQQLKGNKVL